MPEFKCQPGYCVKCCSENGMLLPVTLGDLYRIWFYREKTGNGASFYDVFREQSNDWVLAPSPGGEVYAVPISKMPCHNLDKEAKKCSVHGFARYTGCTLFPEDMLLPAPPGYRDSKKTIDFLNSLECTRGLTLTDERKRHILELRGLVDMELHLTTRFLESVVFSHSFVGDKPSKRVQRELDAKMRFISDKKENMRTLRLNLVNNRILQDYERFVMTEDPGFSYCEEI